MSYYTTYKSPIGKLTIVSDSKNIIGLWIEHQKYFLETIKDNLIKKDNLDIFIKTKTWLDKYFAGQNPSINTLKLKPTGTPFRQEVWKLLCEIPYGKVTTYKDIANKIATIQNKQAMSPQAIGGAISHNPISIIIPCHRVIGTNGTLTGYAGGINIKEKLLELEKNSI